MNKKAVISLVQRLAAFFGIFVLYSGAIGPRIIGTHLLYDGYFFVYGALGKALLFAGVAFVLLARGRTLPKLQAWHPRLATWLGLSLTSYVFAWIAVEQLLGGASTGFWTVFAHLGLLGSVAFALLAVFGRHDLYRLWSGLHQAILGALAAAAGFYLLLELFYASWRIFAGLVMHAVRGLLDVAGISAVVVAPNTLLLDKFGITVAQACSGVESMALFTGLYIVVGLLDRKKLDMRRFIGIFPVALAGLFGFNILRVFVLILGGYYISPEVAFTLFHTYAGMVFFILYAGVFFWVGYRWLLKKPGPVDHS